MNAIIDTLRLLPFLVITFIAIEIFEHRFGKKVDDKIKTAGKLGPLVGAMLGIIPQCGFSVMSVAFYSQGYITLGTMIAVFISTSDEALPILISTPGAAKELLPFIVTKFIFAILWGYVIDILIAWRRGKRNKVDIQARLDTYEDECVDKPINIKNITFHSLKRTVKIAAYIFVVNLAISLILEHTAVQAFNTASVGGQFTQVFVAALLGLVPNCAVSVGLIQFYLAGALSFSSLIAGLSSNAGLALLVLFKESKNKKNAVLITLVLVLTSIITGVILNFL